MPWVTKLSSATSSAWQGRVGCGGKGCSELSRKGGEVEIWIYTGRPERCLHGKTDPFLLESALMKKSRLCCFQCCKVVDGASEHSRGILLVFAVHLIHMLHPSSLKAGNYNTQMPHCTHQTASPAHPITGKPTGICLLKMCLCAILPRIAIWHDAD